MRVQSDTGPFAMPGQRPERDGCGCPAWVVRCAHWEGKVLVLCSSDSVKRQLKESGWSERRINRELRLVDRRRLPCSVHGPGVWAPDGPEGIAYTGLTIGWESRAYYSDSLPAAQAEFSKREVELLGRGQ